MKSLHGMRATLRPLSLRLRDFIRSTGRAPSRAYLGTWIEKDSSRDSCTLMLARVGDFLIAGIDLDPAMEAIK